MTIKIKDNKVTLTFDLNTDPQPSKSSGKSLINASTGGFMPLAMISQDLPADLQRAKINLTVMSPLK